VLGSARRPSRVLYTCIVRCRDRRWSSSWMCPCQARSRTLSVMLCKLCLGVACASWCAPLLTPRAGSCHFPLFPAAQALNKPD
jgi:hypothetical protein